MSKPSRIGNDPLSWIQDSRSSTIEIEEKSAERLQSLQCLQSKQEDVNFCNTEKSEISRTTSQQGLPEGWTRATFILKADTLERLKDCAYWERKSIKELLNEVIEAYTLQQSIPQRPKKKRLEPGN